MRRQRRPSPRPPRRRRIRRPTSCMRRPPRSHRRCGGCRRRGWRPPPSDAAWSAHPMPPTRQLRAQQSRPRARPRALRRQRLTWSAAAAAWRAAPAVAPRHSSLPEDAAKVAVAAVVRSARAAAHSTRFGRCCHRPRRLRAAAPRPSAAPRQDRHRAMPCRQARARRRRRRRCRLAARSTSKRYRQQRRQWWQKTPRPPLPRPITARRTTTSGRRRRRRRRRATRTPARGSH